MGPSNRFDRERGLGMKKIDPRRGIWDWLFGGGWSSGGANG